MSLIVNGTDIKKVIINNTELNKVIINNTEVWTAKAPYYDEIKNATSNVSEAKWLAFVEGDGIAQVRANGDTSSFIGKNVTLSNTEVSNYSSWKIADFNHDGSGDTCDLIQNANMGSNIYGTYIETINGQAVYSGASYYVSNVRSWLNNTYLPAFNTNVKNKLKVMSFISSIDSTYIHDKIRIPSVDEVGMSSSYSTHSDVTHEGTKYPIFNTGGTTNQERDSSRIRSGASNGYFLRSSTSNKVFWINQYGGFAATNSNSSSGTTACIRFYNPPSSMSAYETVLNTNSISELQWLAFLNSDGIKTAMTNNETSKIIGKDVTLSNSADSTYTSWKIADFNHDGSGYTVDLILNNNIHNTTFNYSYNNTNNTVRRWLNDTYLPGFSTNVKSKLQTMSIVGPSGTIYEKIKILSATETGIINTSNVPTEGNSYPIFGTPASGTNYVRVRKGSNTSKYYFIRTSIVSGASSCINKYGIISNATFGNSGGVVPCIRFA